MQALRLNLVARVAPERILHRTAVLTPDRYEQLGVVDARLLAAATDVTVPTPALRRFLDHQGVIPHEAGTFQTEEVKVWTLEGVQLEPKTGAVVAADGTLIIDSLKNVGRIRRVAAYSRGIPDGQPYLGTISTIATTHMTNYFHWLIEALPRLHSLALVDEAVTLVMPTTLSALQQKTLAMCRPANVTVQYVDPAEWLRAERFILPSFLARQWDFSYLPYGHLEATRNHIFHTLGLSPDHAGQRRIYISRAKASLRRVTNDAAVLALLAPLGFETVYLEDLTFEEQVRTLHDAAIVVAPHGAGLANLLFAGRIPVVEFATPIAMPVFFSLALALGQDFRYVFPEEMDPAAVDAIRADPQRHAVARRCDITVPLADLQPILDELVRE